VLEALGEQANLTAQPSTAATPAPPTPAQPDDPGFCHRVEHAGPTAPAMSGSWPRSCSALRSPLQRARPGKPYRKTRFQDILAGTGAPRDVLTSRPRKLEEKGVIDRRPYSERPPR
jgi:HxlR-like helix-turn-helix